jgi:endonuclease/exonuclease/phosphatase family metal-dependent hydrolase
MIAASGRLTVMSWRVTTWNLQGSASPPLDRVAEVVTDLAPDVLVLQEIRRAQCRRLARALRWRRTWHRKHHPYSPLVWWTTEGMAIITPHRLSGSTSQTLTPGLSTWTYRHRVAVQATVRQPDGTALHVVDVHLASDADGADERAEQASRLRALVDSLSGTTVVAGDFNDHGDTSVTATVAGDSHVDAWDVATSGRTGDGATNPSHAPFQRLDHVLIPRHARRVSAAVPTGDQRWAELSDHLPLTVEFDTV